MTKAILMTKGSSNYDDRPEEYYHFPRTYLAQVSAAVGDQIIYYEPRRTSADLSSRGGRRAYFATASVDQIAQDPTRPDHYYASISMYLSFDRAVPFLEGEEYYEAALRKPDGSTNKGAFGRAVRLISDQEFDRILKAGFAKELTESTILPKEVPSSIDEPDVPFERPMVELTISRPFRDQVFKRQVRSAYDNQCALTGLRLINGGGRPEVQAAHIKPVSRSGPDLVRNGIALSSTVHWMFDRGLVSIDENHRILVDDEHVPDQVRSLLNKNGELILPRDQASWPHPHYLKFHRENIFKRHQADV